jgi:hypothetical protein
VAAAAAAIGCPLQVLGETVASGLRASWGAALDRPLCLDRVATLRLESELHGHLLKRLLPSRSGAVSSQK